MFLRFLCFVILATSTISLQAQQTREQKVRDDRRKVEADGFWIYNDFQEARRRAKTSGKPILVVLRCIPCEECVKLDDELVDKHPVIRPLLEQFECVRLVATNGLDLSLFQFDTDQSFAVFMLNEDKTIYGRFGTRSHRTDWNGDVSLEGLAEALRGALQLHAAYPANRQALAGKRGAAPEFPSPEKYPELDDRFGPTLDYAGQVAKSCIHCHQIGDAQRSYFRERKEQFPDRLLFPYPHPKALGLILDPKTRATVVRVEPDTYASRAGLQAGDTIAAMNGQPLLSIADVQWVLHNTPPEGGEVKLDVVREARPIELLLTLKNDWRTLDDLSWRVSSWGLRRMTTGGLVLKPATDQERERLGLNEDQMALRVDHVGQYNAHAAAKRAGFQKNDFLVAFDGRTDLRREADLFRHALNKTQVGEKVVVEVNRRGQRLSLQLPMQK